MTETLNLLLNIAGGTHRVALATIEEGGVRAPSTPGHHCNRACSTSYHAQRAVQETELAESSYDSCSKSAHLGLAWLHRQAVSRERRAIQLIVAPRVD
jgi:hypothetical protein